MKVLVAIDDSPFSEEVLRAVNKRHWTKDTEFCVVHVVQPIIHQEYKNGKWAELVFEANRKRLEAADKLCSDARHAITKHVPNSIVHYEVRQGDPREELIDAATEWSADKIMIGTHGHKTCPHFLLGSVSREIAHNVHCTVEVVRHKHHEHKHIA